MLRSHIHDITKLLITLVAYQRLLLLIFRGGGEKIKNRKTRNIFQDIEKRSKVVMVVVEV